MEKIKVGDIEFPERKVYLRTYGCQMNTHDSERMLNHLQELNFTPTNEKSDADLILFNTCAIRDHANSKFYSHLGEVKRLKENNKNIVVGVGGCVAQMEATELVEKYRHLDFAFGTDVIDQIKDLVYRSYAGDKNFTVTSWDRSQDYSIETKRVNGSPQAFVNIIKGCDKFCSYCVVPFTRGREKSRYVDEIVNDVKKLVKHSGVQEITLLGQNVNSFGKKNGESLAQLITELDKISGLQLIRYTTSHPYDVSDELIAVHGSAKKLSRHLHLPVQSGSDSVLERMLREYSVEHFENLVKKLRASNPEIVLSTDIIVGFPNETKEEFQGTMDLLERVKFDFIYSYTYSPRPGTKAMRLEDSLTDDERGERLRKLQAHQLRIQLGLRQKLVGTKQLLLVEGKNSRYGTLKWAGRTNCMRKVHFLPESEGKDYQWHWVLAEITEATALSCQGRILEDYGLTLPEKSAQSLK